MKKYDGYEKTEAFTGEYENLEPGGYICKILKVVSEEKDYGVLLRIGFDIVEGEHKDFYRRMHDKAKEKNPDAKWRGMYYQTVKPNDLKYFKGFITAIENSNSGYTWSWDEKTLVGKLFGGIFGQEEYKGNDGKTHLSTKLQWVRSVDCVREGKYSAPNIKRLAGGSTSNASANETILDDDELPF